MSTSLSKNPIPVAPQYIDITQEKTPTLTEADRTIIKELLEGCLTSLDHKNVVQVIREQLRFPSRLTEAEKARIEEIAQSTDWALWAGQFKYWLGTGHWFRTMKGIIL